MTGLINRILKLSGKYAARIKAAFVFSFFKSMLSKAPVLLAFLILRRFYEGDLTGTYCLWIGIAMVLAVAAETLCQFLCDKLQSASGYMMFAEKRLELGAHLKRLPMGYFTAGNISKISSVLSTDMAFVEEIVMGSLANMMNYIFTAVIMTALMLLVDFRLGLVTVGVSLLAVLVAGKMNRVSLREAKARQEQSEKLTDAVLSFIEGIGVIKSFDLLGEKSQELSESFRDSRDTSIGFEESLTPWQRGLNVIYALGMTVLFGLSIYLQQTGQLTVPYMMGMLLFLFDLFGPLKALYGEAARLTVMNSCLDRIEEVLDERELPDEGKRHIPPKAADRPEIELRDVSFAYGDKEVLHHIDLTVMPDTMAALAGPSGGGKTTVANLIARFWDVKEGQVLIRGQDIREVPLAELMDHISMVFQRVYLFRDTVYNNISMGKPDADREEVYQAARKARCYDFIMELPDGFDTVIGEGGATLSGGEKQRISIARCILKDAPVIILDEATASVDVDNERYIQEAISELVRGKTLLVIAHRLNTIKGADNITVIEKGRVTQQGDHQALMAEGGTYREYVELRERTNGWKLV